MFRAGWKATSSNESAQSIQPFIAGESPWEFGGEPAVSTLPPVQNRCLNRKECERGS